MLLAISIGGVFAVIVIPPVRISAIFLSSNACQALNNLTSTCSQPFKCVVLWKVPGPAGSHLSLCSMVTMPAEA
jgi:hypothetical protein